MLYVLIEAERARTKKMQKGNRLQTLEWGTLSGKCGRDAEPSSGDVPVRRCAKEPVSSLSQSQIRDSGWLTRNPQEILAWAKMSTDPRIAAGQQSPLEKKILNLGGVRTTAARQLVAQKYQEEHETLRREQALSLDYWLAQPRGRSRIKVNVLVEKNREEGNTVIKPHQRRYLTVPPYMRSQIGKIKGIKFQCF
ncbi:uncharacterized protein LOC115296606 isoform X3 [Suricata suricatta]|uniref:uncharacterized protein LOC115296606 isoform X3 n=1 Tax=Suricata suricatta TaxID=37032 RepID=UPI001155984C|nr:uncharacterized protein LOC115296606 isoform X3 [Suricata suricatta]